MRWRCAGFCFFQCTGSGSSVRPHMPRQRVIDVAGGIVAHQRLVAGQGGRDSDLLRSPIEIAADRVGREDHERAHASCAL